MESQDQVIDQLLRILRRRSVEGYEIFFESSDHFEVEAKEDKVDTFQASQSWGLSLRLLHQKRMGFSFATSPSTLVSGGLREGLERLVEDAMAASRATSPDPCYEFAPPLKAPPPELPINDRSLREISEKRKIEYARNLEASARSFDRRVTKVRKASYQESSSKVTLLNSNGLHFTYDLTFSSVSVVAIAEEGGESEMGWDFDFSHFFDRIDVHRVGQNAAKRAVERLGGRRISSGSFPAILENQVAAEFLSLLAHSFLSEQVQKGKSVLKDRLGTKFFSSLLNLVDDGLQVEGASASPIDGEGTPSQRTLLVSQGEVRGFLYDRFWANRERLGSSRKEVESTGNSRRHSIKAPPGLGTSNFFIEAGKTPLATLIRNLNRGVLIQEVMGLHTVDPISGDFSLGCSGQWIEGGEVLHPVKSIAVAGNLYQLFQNLVEVGDDLRFFGKIGSPSLTIDRLELSGN
ncbi:MAG: TldD/PmbA family protein [Desulfobacterota bacterium]|nr:TldD/PmbA family protein [Thermodesulfobacteriota bacterium]